jgi:branched-chain amino acid transport system permease protein
MTILTDAIGTLADPVTDRVKGVVTSPRTPAMLARRTVAAVVFFAIIQAAFHLSVGEIISGLSIGGLYGIIGVALVLCYRTSRVINFAAAAVGAVPAITAILLSTSQHISYLLTMPIAIVGGLVFGILTDVLVLRRFGRASRLIVTVVTIGVAQSYAAIGFFIPVWFGERAAAVPKVTTPWQNVQLTNSRGNPILTGNQVFAFSVVVVMTLLLAYFLKRTRLGIALRASSENGDRAALLGIPVATVTTAAWAIAGVLSALAVFAQAPLIGVPSDATLGFDTLLYGLAAALVARMENVGLALLTGLGIGLVYEGSILAGGTDDYTAALVLVLVLGVLLFQRRSRSRAVEGNASNWQTVAAFRPIPVELRSLPEVVRLKAIGLAAAAAVAIVLPFVVSAGDMNHLTLLPIYGIVGVSLVVLTGWAGQISLGQFGLVGIGAAAAGGLVGNHNIDFFVAVFIAMAAGAITAVIIGLPAIRVQGLYLAATTLAFGYAMQNYILNDHYWIGRHLLPANTLASSIVRPVLYGKFDLENDKAFYFLCLGFLVLSVAAAASFRRQHSGRILIALRDNQRAAASYAVSPLRTRLSAFAISGAFAGLAGVLLAYLDHSVIHDTYSVFASVGVFLAAAIGGLGSLAGGVLGVIAFEASVVFGALLWHHLGNTMTQVMPLLLTGPLLVLNLYINPGGLAGWIFQERDKWLRRLAAKHDIHVPSLVADSLVDEQPMPEPELLDA